MSDLDVRPVPDRTVDADLAALLRKAARGDIDAFLRFYDATIQTVFDWARLRHQDPDLCEAAVRAVYALAWADAGGHADSGLSPRAWLLCLSETDPKFSSLLNNLWNGQLALRSEPAQRTA